MILTYIFQQNRKFIAAQTRNTVAETQTFLESARASDNQAIANSMTKSFVHGFKTIQVQRKNRKVVIAFSFDAFQRPPHSIHEQRAVRQICELIAKCMFGLLLIRDVFADCDDSDR